MEDKRALLGMYESVSDEALRWGIPPYDKGVIDRRLNSLPNLFALLGWYDGKIVGYVHILKFPRSRREGIGDLIIYLHQDFRNVGLGTAMLTELLRVTKSRGMHRTCLEVVVDNERAVHLYKKVGFKVEGVLKDAYLGKMENIMMS
jgi:putative acetyltransferase